MHLGIVVRVALDDCLAEQCCMVFDVSVVVFVRINKVAFDPEHKLIYL